jgi:hypothetical protein
MYIAELFESELKHAAFCFGRMNPPTIGHAQLIDTVAQSSNGDYFIFVSQTQDSKKNPLDFGTKIAFLKQMFPEHAAHIVDQTGITTALHAANLLYNAGYRSVTFVAGSDRLLSFQKLLTDYNGVEGKGHGYYKFKNIEFASSGERDPDADGLAGISASKARDAAKDGDLAAFAAATGAGDLAEPLYNAVRAGMRLNENSESKIEIKLDGVEVPGPFNDIDHARNKASKLISYQKGKVAEIYVNGKLTMRLKLNTPHEHFNEDAAGVGVIANKKQASDPRYMMSLTKDVRPGEVDRQLKKFKLKEKWSQKYKQSINCNDPKGFSQRAHCQGRKK